jgi:hypothetical protein
MTLNVDYGDHVEVFKYSVPAQTDQRLSYFEFCRANFVRKNWHYYHYDNLIYFKRKKDLMWFKLRFGI